MPYGRVRMNLFSAKSPDQNNLRAENSYLCRVAGYSSISVLYEDNHLIAVSKSSGQLAQGDRTGDDPLGVYVQAYIKEKYHKPGAVFLGLIHRLDRPVSGIMLFARTSKALSRMNEQFQSRKITKTYLALCEAAPDDDSGTLVHFLHKNESANKSFASAKEAPGYLRCELEYRVLQRGERYHLLEIKPHTGRHHQIRVQLSSSGWVIKGDLKYGSKRSNTDGSICLHAFSIEFTHPVSGQEVYIKAPVPGSDVWPHFREAAALSGR